VSHVKECGFELDTYNLIKCLSKNHTAGTKVDIFSIDCTKAQVEQFECFLLSQVGEKYDFWAILRFLTRKPFIENSKWFCSELIDYGLRLIEIYLQMRIESYKMPPQLVGISPIPQPIRQIITI